jgi:hypothetical protein
VRHYRAYGLLLGCDEPLPELEAVERRPDVEVDVQIHMRAGAAPTLLPAAWQPSLVAAGGEICLESRETAEGYWLRSQGLATAEVSRAADRVRIFADADTPAETLRHFLLDCILPLSLTLRGLETLHASAVLVDGAAVAFLAPSGTGKSTLAAHFSAKGHDVLCDDCLAIELDGDRVLAVPAYPGLRLWPDSWPTVGPGTVQPTAPVAHNSSKRRVTPLAARSPAARFPLRALFVLERAQTPPPSVERLSGAHAVMALVRSSFRLDHSDPAVLRRQLEHWGQLLPLVPAYRLVVPEGLHSLEAVRHLVLETLGPAV